MESQGFSYDFKKISGMTIFLFQVTISFDQIFSDVCTELWPNFQLTEAYYQL